MRPGEPARNKGPLSYLGAAMVDGDTFEQWPAAAQCPATRCSDEKQSGPSEVDWTHEARRRAGLGCLRCVAAAFDDAPRLARRAAAPARCPHRAAKHQPRRGFALTSLRATPSALLRDGISEVPGGGNTQCPEWSHPHKRH